MRQDIYDLTVAYILENQEKFYRLAYSYVQDRDSALDVVQNSICQALEKCWGLRNPAAMKTWFYRIVVNEALQYLRRHKKEISTEPSEMREEPYQEEGFLKADAGSGEVYEQIQKLSLIHISEPTRLGMISYAVFCLKKKNKNPPPPPTPYCL